MDLANAVIAPRAATKVPLNRTVVESTMTASLGGLLFGFDTAVIAGVTRALTQKFHLSPTSLGFTVAIALWGTIVGAACGVTLAAGLAAATACVRWPFFLLPPRWAAHLLGIGSPF